MAKTDIKIFDAYKSEMRIADYNKDSQMHELIKGLGTWVYYLGLSQKTSEKELIMNAQFIRENFGSLNIVDISEAIKLSISDPKFQEHETFGVFSPIYISKILHLYKTVRSNIIVDTNQKLSRIQAESEIKKPTKEDSIANMKFIINDAWETVNAQKDTYADFGDLMYNFIIENKLVPITKELVADGKKYAKEVIIKESRESAINRAITYQPFLKVDGDKLHRKKGREFVVNFWLKSMTKEEVKLFIKELDYS